MEEDDDDDNLDRQVLFPRIAITYIKDKWRVYLQADIYRLTMGETLAESRKQQW